MSLFDKIKDVLTDIWNSIYVFLCHIGNDEEQDGQEALILK